MRRSRWTAGIAGVALLVGLAACSSGDDDAGGDGGENDGGHSNGGNDEDTERHMRQPDSETAGASSPACDMQPICGENAAACHS